MISLRNVTKDDGRLLFDWRNDPQKRKNSFNTAPLHWEEHLKWFEGKLKNPGTQIFILMAKENPVGQIRFDVNNDEALVDITVDSKARGKGYGSEGLRKPVR